MKPFTWIVSYPRSGNTFLRALLATWLAGAARPLSLAEISASTVGEHDEALWTRLTGQPPAERTVEAQWRARAAYIRARREAADPGQALFKSHTVNSTAFGLPAFEFAPGDRILHVVRHPCDVALSCAAYWGLSVDAAIERMTTRGFAIDGRPRHGFEVLGAWDHHVRAWLDATAAPIRHVSYFDLVDRTEDTLRGVVEFLGHAPDPERLRAAVAFCSFEALRAQEDAAGFTESSETRSDRFFRVGRALQWPGQLSDAQVARLTAPAADLLETLDFNRAVAERQAASRA